MINKLSIAVFLTTLLAVSSCKKFLELRPEKQIAVPTSISDFQALLDNKGIMNNGSPTYDVFSADEYVLTNAAYNAFPVTLRKAWIWENYEYLYRNDWARIYEPIYYANVVLENLDPAERNQQNAAAWDNVKGSALLYRSASYLKGLWIFAKAYDPATAAQDFGIALRTSDDFNTSTERTSVVAGYETLINELMIAATLLPDHPVHPVRPSRAAAYGFLSRAYLSMRVYDSAFKYADLCLGLKDDLLDYNTTNINDQYPFGLQVLNPEVIMDFETSNTSYSVGSTRRVDSALYESMGNTDLRKRVLFRTRSDGYQFKGSYTGSIAFQYMGIATNEMYLVRAECNARAGNTVAAMADVNELLKHRFVTGTFVELTAANAAEALSIILYQRRLELFSRGLRWMDIKRLNKEGAGIILKRVVNGVEYTLQPNENRYALPLPMDIVNLTGMPQNPK